MIVCNQVYWNYISKQTVETFKCDICEFRTQHNQGLKSQMTKMHGMKNQHSCEECSETFAKERN